MKITKHYLRQIIKEELQKEMDYIPASHFDPNITADQVVDMPEARGDIVMALRHLKKAMQRNRGKDTGGLSPRLSYLIDNRRNLSTDEEKELKQLMINYLFYLE